MQSAQKIVTSAPAPNQRYIDISIFFQPGPSGLNPFSRLTGSTRIRVNLLVEKTAQTAWRGERREWSPAVPGKKQAGNIGRMSYIFVVRDFPRYSVDVTEGRGNNEGRRSIQAFVYNSCYG